MGRAKAHDFELFHKQVGNERSNGGNPWQHHGPVLIITLEEEVSVLKTKLQKCGYLLIGHVGPLCEEWACYSFCLMILMEGSMGIEFKRALTS